MKTAPMANSQTAPRREAGTRPIVKVMRMTSKPNPPYASAAARCGFRQSSIRSLSLWFHFRGASRSFLRVFSHPAHPQRLTRLIHHDWRDLGITFLPGVIRVQAADDALHKRRRGGKALERGIAPGRLRPAGPDERGLTRQRAADHGHGFRGGRKGLVPDRHAKRAHHLRLAGVSHHRDSTPARRAPQGDGHRTAALGGDRLDKFHHRVIGLTNKFHKFALNAQRAEAIAKIARPAALSSFSRTHTRPASVLRARRGSKGTLPQ